MTKSVHDKRYREVLAAADEKYQELKDAKLGGLNGPSVRIHSDQVKALAWALLMVIGQESRKSFIKGYRKGKEASK